MRTMMSCLASFAALLVFSSHDGCEEMERDLDESP